MGILICALLAVIPLSLVQCSEGAEDAGDAGTVILPGNGQDAGSSGLPDGADASLPGSGPGPACDLVHQDCSADHVCYLDDTGKPFCAPGGGQIPDGEPCAAATDCHRGSVCVSTQDGDKCYPICDPDETDPCIHGTCTEITGTPWGVCIAVAV